MYCENNKNISINFENTLTFVLPIMETVLVNCFTLLRNSDTLIEFYISAIKTSVIFCQRINKKNVFGECVDNGL